MSKSYFSGPINVLGAAGADNVVQIRSAADTVATSITRTQLEKVTTDASLAELNLLASAPHVNGAALSFDVVNLATNQAYVAVKWGSGLDLSERVVPRAGSLTAIAVYANAGRTAGSAQFFATINGTTKSALKATLDATNATYAYSAVAKDTSGLTVTAGQRVGVKVLATTDWAPATGDVGVDLFYEY